MVRRKLFFVKTEKKDWVLLFQAILLHTAHYRFFDTSTHTQTHTHILTHSLTHSQRIHCLYIHIVHPLTLLSRSEFDAFTSSLSSSSLSSSPSSSSFSSIQSYWEKSEQYSFTLLLAKSKGTLIMSLLCFYAFKTGIVLKWKKKKRKRKKKKSKHLGLL